MGESNEAGDNKWLSAAINTYFEKAERQGSIQEWSTKLITCCAEAVTGVTSKTAKLSWVKV